MCAYLITVNEVFPTVPLTTVPHGELELLLKCVFFLARRKYVGPGLEQYL